MILAEERRRRRERRERRKRRNITLGPFSSVCTKFPSSTFTFFNVAINVLPIRPIATATPIIIPVSGIVGTITKVTATIFNITHTSPFEIDALLVAPNGSTNTILMSDAGFTTSITNTTLTFDDNATNFLPLTGLIPSGTFKPTNFDLPPDPFPAPAPSPSASVALSNFNGMNPNGNWSLFIVDDTAPGNGSFQGWSISITTHEKEKCVFTSL